MRAVACVLMIVACSPDISSGSYLCGPQELCPEGMACNGPDNTCVTDVIALPFDCGPVSEQEPNDAASAAQDFGQPACVSSPIEVTGCEEAGDLEDWFKLVVPTTCGAVAIQARAGFPIAFVPFVLEIRADDDSVIAASMPCTPVGSEDSGQAQACVASTAAPGGHYAIRITRAGTDDCGGACANNRYRLSIQLAQP